MLFGGILKREQISFSVGVCECAEAGRIRNEPRPLIAPGIGPDCIYNRLIVNVIEKKSEDACFFWLNKLSNKNLRGVSKN